MKIEEYEKLMGEVESVLTVDSLENKTPRTLLYGYTCSRDTWHVFINQFSEIVTIMYGYGDNAPLNIIPIQSNEDFIPDKRLYPACCDFEFCLLLKQKGIHLNFTTYEEPRELKTYYGRI